MTADSEWVGLAQAVHAIRRELIRAAAEGADHPMRFDVDSVVIELAVAVRRETGAQAGASVWVSSLAASVSRGAETTHRLTLTLTPQDVEISDGDLAENVDAIG